MTWVEFTLLPCLAGVVLGVVLRTRGARLLAIVCGVVLALLLVAYGGEIITDLL